MPARPNLTSIAFGCLAALASAGALGAQVVTRQVTIRIVTEAEGAPLGYAVVAVPELRLERFTSEVGAIAFPMPVGVAHRVIVKRLGFVPKDTSITVTNAPGQMFRIALRRLSIALTPVRVVDWPPCMDPGVPRRGEDSVGYDVVGQLRQNGERYALLTKEYPFIYASERIASRELPGGGEVVDFTDTVMTVGGQVWNYRPGRLVVRHPFGFRARSDRFTLRLPTIFHLGENEFVANHCFHVAGVEEKFGQQLLRVDIVAADLLEEPDVNVAVWLDTADFRIRFATFVLTKIPRELPEIEQLMSEVSYLDLIPFVPVGFMTFSENIGVALTIDATAGTASRAARATRFVAYERQQVLDVRFTGEKPAGFVPTPLPPKRRRP